MACMDFNDADMAAMIPRYIFPLIVRGCQDDDTKVRKTSQTATITLVEHNIFNSQLIKLICPIVLEISYHNDEDPAVGAINVSTLHILPHNFILTDQTSFAVFFVKDMGSEMFLSNIPSHYLVFHGAYGQQDYFFPNL